MIFPTCYPLALNALDTATLFGFALVFVGFILGLLAGYWLARSGRKATRIPPPPGTHIFPS